MFFLIQHLRTMLAALCANDSSRQLAFGVSLGMAIGLVPKGNLIAAVLVVVLFSLKVNHGLAICSAFLFSWIGALLDPISHHVGAAVLTSRSLEPVFEWMIDAPLLPWTNFNNTVVLGSLLLAVISFAPVYRIAKAFFERYRQPLGAWLAKYKIDRLLFGGEWAARWNGT